MASKLYLSGFAPSDTFRRDLKVVVACPSEKLRDILRALADQTALARMPSEKVTAAIAQRFGVAGFTVQACMSLANFVVRVMRDYGDSASQVAADVSQDLALAPEEKRALEAFFGNTEQLGEAAQRADATRHHARKAIPNISHTSYVCDLRLVTDSKGFDAWTEPIDDYRPKYYGLVPVSTFRFRFDRESPVREVVFQASEVDLESLITVLKQAAVDMKNLRAGKAPKDILPSV